MNKVTTVIFDMDGVIVDSHLHWRSVQAEFLQRLIPGWNQSLQKSILGMSVFDLHKLLQTDFALTLSSEEFIERYRDLSTEIYGNRCNSFPGVCELISALRSDGIVVAILSSSPRAWIDLVIKRFNLRFDFVISSEDVGTVTKPDPKIYQYALSTLEISVSEVVAVEDSEKGIKSASGAGIRCIGFRNGYNEEEDFSKATWEIRNFSELRQLEF